MFSTDKVLLTLASNGLPGSDDSLGCINMIRLQGLSSLEKRGVGWEGAHGSCEEMTKKSQAAHHGETAGIG